VMNFDMAREMCGRDVETVITDDDVAVENSLYTTGRRGVAGTRPALAQVPAAGVARHSRIAGPMVAGFTPGVTTPQPVFVARESAAPCL